MSPRKRQVRSSGASARTKLLGSLLGGRIRLEKLPTTKNISARTFIQGKYVRKSTGESSLSKAKDIAIKWFKELIGRDQKGQRIHGATFADYVTGYLKLADRRFSAGEITQGTAGQLSRQVERVETTYRYSSDSGHRPRG